MKRLLMLVLALTMALAVAVPVLAFTTDVYEEDAQTPYDLDIILVDYEEGYISRHVLSLPERSNGYMKNQVICAVASVYMPKGTSLTDSGYTNLIFSGENVALDVRDNYGSNGLPLLYTNATSTGTVAASYEGEGANTIKIPVAGLEQFSTNAKNRDFTANIAVFAKYLGGNAKMSAELNKNSSFRAYNTESFPTGEQAAKMLEMTSATGDAAAKSIEYILVGDYIVLKVQQPKLAAGKYEYAYFFFAYTTVSEGKYTLNDALFAIYTDSKFKGKAVSFFQKDDNGVAVVVGVKYHEFFATLNHKSELVLAAPKEYVGNDSLLTPVSLGGDRSTYNSIAYIYDKDFVKAWGFDLTKVNNYVKPSYFEGALKAADLYAEVAVPVYTEPTIVVPPVQITNPPKVG